MDLKEARWNRAPRHPWELARLKVVSSLLQRQLPADRPAKILDIGCGDAWLVEQLAARFHESHFVAIDHALEQSELMAIRWRLRDEPIDIFQRLEDAPDRPQEPVDIVLLLDVLEHIEDDERFLEDLQFHAGITSDTRLVITVPAWQGLFCSHDKFLGHYRRYTTAMLEQRLLRSGFAIRESGYFFSGLLAARWAQVLTERFYPPRRAARGIGRQHAWPLWDAALQAGLELDFHLGAALREWGIQLPGLSAFAIASVGPWATCPQPSEAAPSRLCSAK
jgi:SAM-dependent methyltransferase